MGMDKIYYRVSGDILKRAIIELPRTGKIETLRDIARELNQSITECDINRSFDYIWYLLSSLRYSADPWGDGTDFLSKALYGDQVQGSPRDLLWEQNGSRMELVGLYFPVLKEFYQDAAENEEGVIVESV